MDYIYIRAWGEMQGSFQYYIDAQVAQAREDGAPQTATYKGNDGTWHTFESIQREDTKREIQAIVERMTARKKGR